MSKGAPPTLGDRIQDFMIRAMEGAVRLLPEPWVVALGGALGGVAGGVLRLRRRVVEENLTRAFPERDAAWIRKTAGASYRHLGKEAVALLRMGALGPRQVWERTEVDGIHHLREPLARGQGVILLTGHLGNWEVGGASLAVREIPLDVVARRQNNPLFNARLNRTREALGMRVVDRSGSTKTLLRALRSGRAVALVADQNVLTGGVFVDFFGVPAATARGPALLAQRAGAAVVFATALRLPGLRSRYHVALRPLDPPPPGLEAEAATRDLLRRYLSALEEAIGQAPAQYLWAHKRWKTRPEAAELPREAAELPPEAAQLPPDAAELPPGDAVPVVRTTAETNDASRTGPAPDPHDEGEHP